VDDPSWVAVDIKPGKRLPRPVSLADIRASKKLNDLLLVRQSPLSVMPVTREDFDEIVRMGSAKAK
jgi:predicted RNA-binding protein with PUA-like domain